MSRFMSRKLLRAFSSEPHTDAVEVTEIDGIRSLHIGSSVIQSSMRVKSPYTLELAYSRGMMMYKLFAPHAHDIVVLGLGGGSIPKYIHHFFEEDRTRVLEINPEVIKVARSHFYLPDDDARLHVLEGDGREYLHNNPETTQVLMLDAFGSTGLPSELSSQEFFDICANALQADGMALFNLWGSDKNFDIYLQRIEQSFNNRVWMMPTGRPGNIVVFAFKQKPAELRWEAIRSKAREWDNQYELDFMGLLERLKDHNPNTPHKLIMD